MLWTHSLKSLSKQFNVFKVYGDGITTMENFSGTTKDIFLKNHHTWGCPVYVLNEGLQGNIVGLTK